MAARTGFPQDTCFRGLKHPLSSEAARPITRQRKACRLAPEQPVLRHVRDHARESRAAPNGGSGVIGTAVLVTSGDGWVPLSSSVGSICLRRRSRRAGRVSGRRCHTGSSSSCRPLICLLQEARVCQGLSLLAFSVSAGLKETACGVGERCHL